MHPSGSFTCLDDWLRWLETLSPAEIDLGLDRVDEVLARLALRKPLRVVIVAGTNGKGSSVAMFEALLIAGGESVGSYTSPHIHRFNERIRLNGNAASDADIIAAFEIVEEARHAIPLTYFEFGTLAAMVFFDTVRPSTLILEVGLGGRLDAVNAINPDACLITNVTLDHCDWLGDDVESIAIEKAGVMRSHKPVIFGSKTVPAAIERSAAETGAKLILLGRDFDFEIGEGSRWNWAGNTSRLNGLVMPSLAGRHQVQNAAAVLAVIDALGLSAILAANLINQSLAGVDLPGRIQQVDLNGKSFILDVAHNADSARVLCTSLNERAKAGRTLAVVGVLSGKDVTGIVSALSPAIDTWIACTMDVRNAVIADDLAGQITQASGRPCLIVNDIEKALIAAEARTAPGDTILVTGSFHAVGPALNWLDDFRCAT